MPRNTLRYGHKVMLRVPSLNGVLTSTNSAITPLGIRPHAKDDVLSLEDSIFMLIPGDGEFNAKDDIDVREEVKFGHVVRLVHCTQRCPVVHLSNEPAVLDKAAQRVTIDDPARFNSLDPSAALYRTERFRVLPKYKVRGEGERVCEGDHILLQSALSSATFISTSDQKDDRTDGCFEVQCTNEGSCFVVDFYDAEEIKEKSATIRGGQCVTLVHRETSRLFAATHLENSTTDDLMRAIVLDEPLQQNAADPLSIKGITYENLFIIEFEDRGRSGAVQVISREHYRIKSLAAGGYLAVDAAKNRLFFTNDISNPGALFTFHAASDDREQTLQSGGRIFLEATIAGGENQWVSLRNEVLEVNGVELPYLALETCAEESVSDGVEVQLLPFIEYRDLSRVMSLLPPLKKFTASIQESSIDNTTVAQVRANVRQLRRFCYQVAGESHIDVANEVDGVLDNKGQGRLLHQGVPQLLMSLVRAILSSPLFDRTMLFSAEDVASLKPKGQSTNDDPSTPIRYSDIIGVVDDCLSVIQLVVRDNYRASIALRSLLPSLMAACEDIPAAVGCVAEFLRGNSALLEELSEEGCKDLLRFMDLLVLRPRDAVLMQLVGLFASHRDVGFPEAQRVIKERLIDDAALRDSLFFQYSRDALGIIYVEIPEAYLAPKHIRELKAPSRVINGEKVFSVKLSDLPDIASQTRMVGRPNVIPLVAGQLELLSAVCAGRKATSIQTLSTIIDVDILMDSMDKIAVPPIIHSGLINLFSSGVVIDSECTNLEDVLESMRYVVDDPAAPDPFVFEVDVTDSYLVRACTFAKKFLTSGDGIMTSDEGKREELDAVVRLTKALLSRRCWSLSDYTPIIHSLISFLDRRNDEASNDPEVFRDKVMIVQTLDAFVDVLLGVKAARITREFVKNPNEPLFPPMCQFISLEPFSDLSEQFEGRRNALLSSKHQFVSQFQHLRATHVAPEALHTTLLHALDVLQDIASIHNWDLRRESIRFYCRLTHCWESLSLMLENVTVSTSANTEVFNITKSAFDALHHYLSIKRSSHKAAAAIQRLIELLQSRKDVLPKPGETTMADVLGMFQQMKVVDTILTIMGELENINKVRTSESGLTELCLRGLQFLELICSIDDFSRQKIGEEMDKLVFSAVAAPAPFMSVCRTVFVDGKGVFGLSSLAVFEVVQIVGLGGAMGDTAIALLHDILAVKDIAGRYVSKNQQMVWRAILNHKVVAKMIHIHDTWTGKRGVEIRDAKLQGPHAKSEIDTHIAFLDVIYLVAKQNDLVKPEEIRYELFGPNGVDDLMEVVSNLDLAATFRYTYINLLQVLVIEDLGGLAAIFNHRMLKDFLAACRYDIHCGATLLDDQNQQSTNSASPQLQIEGSQSKIQRPTFSIFSDRDQAQAFMGDYLCMAVFPCVRHLMERLSDTARRLHPKVRTTLTKKKAINSESISNKWQLFLQSQFQPLLSSNRVMAGSAGVLLRNPILGTAFMKTLVTSLPFLEETVACRVLHLMRQVIELQENDPDDCSVMLPFGHVEGLHDKRTLTMLKTKEHRQNIAATFDPSRPSQQMLPLVSDLISRSNPRVRDAALHTAIAILDGGNRPMQQTMYDSIVERCDEQIFLHLRDIFSSTRETLVTYVKILKRAADPRDTVDNLGNVTKLLRYTQLLCEGHFRENQEYLRVQPLNVVSVNVIEAMCDALDMVSRCIDFRTVSFATQLVVTLIEVLQGPCRMNQDFCVSAGVAERLVTILTLSVEKDDHDGKQREGLSGVDPEVLLNMQLKSMDGLLALIEGRTEKAYLATLVSSISLKTLCNSMDRSVAAYEKDHGSIADDDGITLGSAWRRFKSYMVPEDVEDELNDDLSLAVNVFIFIRSCLDHQNLLSQNDDSVEFVDAEGYTIKRVLRKTESFHTVNKKVGMVEILREGSIERSYFRILSSSSTNLLKKQKQSLIKDVERDSDNRRLQSFLELSAGLIEEIEFYSGLRRIPLVSLFQDFDYVLDYFSLLWALIVNIAMMVVVNAPMNSFDSELSPKDSRIINGLAIVQIVLQSMMMVNYMIGPMRVNYASKMRKYLSEQIQDAVDEARINLSVEDADVSEYKMDNLSLFERSLHAVYHTCMHGVFLQRVLFLVAAILGLTQSKIWHTIQLLHITNKSSILSNVLLAVTTNGVSLILTSVLMVIVIYIYGAISFYNFTEFFDPNKSGRGYDCQSLVSCWFVHIDAIRNGGGIGDSTSNPYFDDYNTIGFYYAFFRLVYYITVIVIFLNIVFGIIVDSFAQLREEREGVVTDQQSKCFICGIEQNAFDLITPGGFEQHITSEHNMWHYVYFMHYLQVKDEDEFNGQEADVAKKLESRDTSFFPVGQSMATNSAAVPAVDVEEKLAHLTATVDTINARCNALEDQLHAFTETVISELRSMKAALVPSRDKR
ncbi:transmembrane protein, putative [Bodo saltans]|uniref:Transmembrane protein, putative n=1 Tax=Bodo saltans TaxID=75058 RepID=A0A0S4JQF2_BODSA|nr:transmembrane protein, putative [Bodo saltans]|eukprot:CUG92420.1 transmembrane protein, putative [Bodo saltans]